MSEGIDRLIRLSDKERITSNGIERTYFAFLPPNVNELNSIPLVLVLHGALANGENAMRMADMENLAQNEGFILLYPDGAGKPDDRVFTWNSGHCCGYALETNSNDSGFLLDLIQKFQNDYPIDSSRIYLAGLSNGAMMAHRFSCEHSSVVAAFAAVAGAKNFDGVEPSEPVSAIVFHGVDDQHTPYDGGEGEETVFKRHDRPVLEGVKFWVDQNGCDQTPVTEEKLSVVAEKYMNGKNKSAVHMYTINAGGHAWPGGKSGKRYGNVDEPTLEISATELIWDFFKNHPKQKDIL